MTPTPTAMLHQLVALCPTFEKYWENDENIIHREDDGCFTLYGLFSEFSYFVRANFEVLPEPTRRELFDFVEACLMEPDTSTQDNLDKAVSTFLESLAGEPPFSSELTGYMRPKSRVIFDFWGS